MESLSGLQESIFSLFRSPQLNSHEKSKKLSNLGLYRSAKSFRQPGEDHIVGELYRTASRAITRLKASLRLEHPLQWKGGLLVQIRKAP